MEGFDLDEVIITSSKDCVSVINPKTKKVIKTYNIKNVAPKCLTLLSEDYFIAASSNIPDIKMWPVKDEKSITQIISPCGLVNALTASNCGTYCVAAFKQEIRVWNVQSGEMLAMFVRHYQDVTVVKFTSDDAFFLSGSKDGCVQTWVLSKVTSIYLDNPDRVRPLYAWNHHATEVTDIHVGLLGIHSRAVTSSADSTCRIYELDSGLLLTTICLDKAITAVVMDSLERHLILGTFTGTLIKINLYDKQPREIHYNDNDVERSEVKAHAHAIHSLSMSILGDKFVSTSLDSDIILWDVESFTHMVKLKTAGVQNAFITVYPTTLLTKLDASFLVKPLERTFVTRMERDERNDSILFKPSNKKLTLTQAGNFDKYYHPTILYGHKDVIRSEMIVQDVNTENKFQESFTGETMHDMQDLNSQMYAYMLDQGFRSVEPTHPHPIIPNVRRNVPEDSVE